MVRHAKSNKTPHLLPVVLGVLTVVLGAPSIANAEGPPNELFADRKVFSTLPYSDSLQTAWTSNEEGEPQPICGQEVGSTVWYEYQAAEDGVVSVDTRGSSFWSTVAVWTGDELENLERVACSYGFDQHNGFVDYHGNAFFEATAGTSYKIQIGGYYGSDGDLVLNVTHSPAGSISGNVVTNRGDPPFPICVYAYQVEGEGPHFLNDMTRDSGGYFIGGVPDGAYKVLFWDCDQNFLQDNYYNNKTSWEESDNVVVANSAAVRRIDAVVVPEDATYLDVGIGGSGSVTSDPAGIDCGWGGGGYCRNPFEWGSVVTLTATQAPGATFVDWWGCDSTEGNICTVRMDYSKWIYASFTDANPEPESATISDGPQPYTQDRSAEFEFFSNDGPKDLECSLDHEGFDPCESPVLYEDLADGTHFFRVRAVGDGDNPNRLVAEWAWIVDGSAPEIRVIRPTGGIYVEDEHVAGEGPTTAVGPVTVKVRATDPHSYISYFDFEVDGRYITPSREDETHRGATYTFTFQPSEPGLYDIRARAWNPAGLGASTSIQVVGTPAP